MNEAVTGPLDGGGGLTKAIDAVLNYDFNLVAPALDSKAFKGVLQRARGLKDICTPDALIPLIEATANIGGIYHIHNSALEHIVDGRAYSGSPDARQIRGHGSIGFVGLMVRHLDGLLAVLQQLINTALDDIEARESTIIGEAQAKAEEAAQARIDATTEEARAEKMSSRDLISKLQTIERDRQSAVFTAKDEARSKVKTDGPLSYNNLNETLQKLWSGLPSS